MEYVFIDLFILRLNSKQRVVIIYGFRRIPLPLPSAYALWGSVLMYLPRGVNYRSRAVINYRRARVSARDDRLFRADAPRHFIAPTLFQPRRHRSS